MTTITISGDHVTWVSMARPKLEICPCALLRSAAEVESLSTNIPGPVLWYDSPADACTDCGTSEY